MDHNLGSAIAALSAAVAHEIEAHGSVNFTYGEVLRCIDEVNEIAARRELERQDKENEPPKRRSLNELEDHCRADAKSSRDAYGWDDEKVHLAEQAADILKRLREFKEAFYNEGPENPHRIINYTLVKPFMDSLP